jgi:hypothetical protein
MPWASVTLKPGLDVEITPTSNVTGYTATQLLRFKAGLAQKLGGWTKYYPNLVGGVPKFSHAWQDLAINKRFAIGTTTGLVDITSGAYQNIAPQTLTTSVACSFATSSGSPIVTVVDTDVATITPYDSVFFNTPVAVGGLILSGVYQILANVSATSYTISAAANATSTVSPGAGAVPTFTTASGSANVSVGLVAHGLLKGDDIIFPLSTTVGGVTISGRYIVQSVTSADIFVITASNSASATAGPTGMNGGEAGFVYYLAVGPQSSSGVYGSGSYGDGIYGLGTTLTGQTGTNPTNTDWTLDNWGELLVANPEGGGVYYWGPNSGYQNCSLVATAPFYNSGMFVSIAQQMIIAYGSTVEAGIGVYQDPMMVRWCDVEDFTVWTDAIANQAGSYRIPTGSKVVGGAATARQNLIWTDLDLWSMTYTGATFVFSFNKIGANCGLIAKHAHAQLADTVFWMGTNNFFVLSGGGVSPLPCPVWDAVFQDLDTANASKCFAGSNTSFSEVWFFYPSTSGGLGYCDKYAKLNIVEKTWDIGSLQRNTWLDTSVVGSPVALANNGSVYLHESGTDADDAPLNYSYDTGYFYLEDGRETVFIDRIYPDFKWGLYGASEEATVLVTIKAVKYPGGAVSSYGPFTVTKATPFISKRIRARQIMLHFEGNDMGSFTRLGLVRVRFAPDGRGP